MNALLQRSAAAASPALRQALAALLAAEPRHFQALLAPASAALAASEGGARWSCGRAVEEKLGLAERRGFYFSAVLLGFRASDIAGAEHTVDDAPFLEEERPNGGTPDEGLDIWKLGIASETVAVPSRRGITKLFPVQGMGFLGYRELSALQSRVILPTTTGISFPIRHLTTVSHPEKPVNEDRSASTDTVQPQRIKFKRLDKTARHIMNILDKEEVEKLRASREIPDIKPGYIVQLKVEVPENKRRVSVLKGIVIARRNAGLHTTFRLRRMVAGVGVESVFPLYSPNIKEMKVLDKKDVRRAKLYYLRNRMNALKQK